MEKSASLTSGYAAVTEFGTFMQTCSTEVYSGKVWIDNLSFEAFILQVAQNWREMRNHRYPYING